MIGEAKPGLYQTPFRDAVVIVEANTERSSRIADCYVVLSVYRFLLDVGVPVKEKLLAAAS